MKRGFDGTSWQRLIAWGWLAVVLLASAQPSHAKAEQTWRRKLANGLEVIVREDHRAPTVVQMVWYRAGSTDETDGHSGLAHMLEHMMFKGSKRFGPGVFNRKVAEAGGRDNAFTSTDYTAYFQQFPKEQLPLMMDIEADRMRHLDFPDAEFIPERQVVIEERRLRTDDSPPAKLFEQVQSMALQTHPYRRPVIGWLADLEAMTAADARHWYNSWYAPNNAILVIVGDVVAAEVFRLAQQTYGKHAARPLPKRRALSEPPQQGERRLRLNATADQPLLLMAYKAVRLTDVAKDVDPYALQLLTTILDGHDAARLTRSLVRERKIAQSVSVGYDPTQRGPGLFYLQATPSRGVTVDTLEHALRQEIGKIASDGIGEAELARAKTQWAASNVYKRDSMMGQAMEIGSLEAIGIPYDQEATMRQRLEAITADDIRAVAGRYFTNTALTVGIVDPLGLAATEKPAHPPSGAKTP